MVRKSWWILGVSIVLAIGCSKGGRLVEEPPPQIFSPPLGEWQKGSESIQRGSFEGNASIDVNSFYAMTAAQCDRTPALPALFTLGTRLITYRSFPVTRDGNVERDERLDLNQITELGADYYRLESKVWMRSTYYAEDFYGVAPAIMRKVPIEGSAGRYRTDGKWDAYSITSKAAFPGVDLSPIMAHLKEELLIRANPGREEFSQGVFNFGNGDALLAVQRKKIIKVSDSKIFAEIEVRLPREPGLYDVNCVAAIAYLGTIELEHGEFLNEDVTELLYTTAKFEE